MARLDELIAKCSLVARTKPDPEAALRRILTEYDDLRDREFTNLIQAMKAAVREVEAEHRKLGE